MPEMVSSKDQDGLGGRTVPPRGSPRSNPGLTTLDYQWQIGPCGWQLDGRHVRLADVVAADAQKAAIRITQHREAILFLQLVMNKMQGELDEVES